MHLDKNKHWIVWSLMALLSVTSCIQAYPADPDNAALLYYQAFISLPTERLDVRSLSKEGDPNDQLPDYLAQCQPAIEFLVAASKLKHCDWGLRYSQGHHMSMAYVAQCRSLVYILGADIDSLTAEGQYRPALERCLVVAKMGQHIGEENFVSYLSNGGCNVAANKMIRETLGSMPLDESTLLWFQQQLATMSGQEPSLSHALQNEKEFILNTLAQEDVDHLIEAMTQGLYNPLSPEWIEQIKKPDPSFWTGSRRYLENYIQKIQTILDSPDLLKDKWTQLVELGEHLGKDSQDNLHTIVTASWTTPGQMQRILFLGGRSTAGRKMHEAAIGIYLEAARSGSVPTELPTGLPKDPFTGQDFTYQKTEEGFTLARWTDDDTDWRAKLEFKVKF